MADPAAPLDEPTIEAYLDRIGLTAKPSIDLEGLTVLQQAHLQRVPFENLDVYHRREVRTDLEHSVTKVVERSRGGWCFELNGAFGALLESLGFSVLRLGAAVLFAGPTTTVDHLTLEVGLDQPYLVDVGFGESFIEPLCLTNPEPQAGYQLLASPQGTTLARLVDDVPEAHYRFKRVHHALADFDAASDALRADPDKHWRHKPFATRLRRLDEGATAANDRITLTTHTLKVVTGGSLREEPIAADDWPATLAHHFGLHDTL